MKNVAIVVLICIFLVFIAGCKGRTMGNMQSTGDTVEVVIETSAELMPAIDSSAMILQ